MICLSNEFARTLALLRREKGVGQREAARDLNISQALLSHYENGVREPGLPFLCRVCDYYGVSADFLLGRTLNRSGNRITSEDLPDASSSGDSRPGRSGVFALLTKKLVLNSVSLLFDLLAMTGSRRVVQASAAYLSDAIYKLYRLLYQANPKNDPSFFSVSSRHFAAGLTEADMKCAEVELSDALEEVVQSHGPLPDMSNAALMQNFPDLCSSLLSLLHSSGERMSGLQGHSQKPES